MKRTSILSATLLALALPLSAAAQDWTPGENFLNNWDYDGDGKVTAAEVLERRGDLFDGFDTNEDGVLSAEEFADHNAMRDAMQDAQGGPGWMGNPQAQPGTWGRGQGRQVGRNSGGRGYMMQQQAPGRGFGQPQQGWGPQMGYGPQGGWGMPQGYGPQQGWGPQQGYGPQQGWGPQMGQRGMGYGPQQGWGPQMGQRGMGYGPQGFGPQQGMGVGPQGFGPQQGMGFGPQGNGQPGAGPQMMQTQMENALDANNDGQITRDEFVQLGEGWIERFDHNGDGEVTLDDFTQGYRWQ